LNNNVQILKGSARYASAPDIDNRLSITIDNTQKELTEYERNLNINLVQRFDTERQSSTLFNFTCKFTLLFENVYSGLTQPITNPYTPINRNLYYINPEFYRILQTNSLDPNFEIAWAGLPQYHEFEFIRTDYNVLGYTVSDNGQPPHVSFNTLDASYYNWFFYLSYPFENDYTKNLQILLDDGNTFDWTVGNGIPFTIKNKRINGKPVIQLTCPFNHNLSVGDSVELTISCNSLNIFDVYTIGDSYSNNEERIFTIYNLGYNDCGNFYDGAIGLLKKVAIKDNPIESKSKYYVKKHKIISQYTDSQLTKTGFENNPFRNITKFETSALTPNLTPRISIKEGSQSYNLSFKNDIDINNLLDNLNRPVTEFYTTVVNRGYFGFFNKPINNNVGLKQGWEFNLGPVLNPWWDDNNTLCLTNVETNFYDKTSPNGANLRFYYNLPYDIGDSLDGDICEWNDMTQTETVLSEYYHKLTFNQKVFRTSPIGSSNLNTEGYYYKPHYKFQIRVYSDYIEQSDEDNPQNSIIANLPRYAFYSNYNLDFRWRDIYSYGFIDNIGRGVDRPFLNNKHYVHENFIFRLIPEGSNVNTINTTQVNDPAIDDCE